MTASFAPEVVEAICRHMNDDHADDSALIVRMLAERSEAEHCRAVDVDGDGMTFSYAAEDGSTVDVRIPFATLVTDRPGVRTAVVELYERACAVAGIAPRGH